MKKITPITEKTHEASLATYRQLYADIGRYVSMKLKWRGIHTLTVHELGDTLDGAAVMDVGCGYGRFSFLAARRARRVVGIDMTPQAYEVAKCLKSALHADNVEFACTEVEKYQSEGEAFDIITLGGVLEHLIDPASVMESLHAMLKPGGILVSNSPTESNFRGDVSTTLWKLFDFPMSLSDVRLVTHEYMAELAERFGFTLERSLGVAYSRGWGDLAGEDLPPRLDNVLRDVAPRLGPDFTVNKAAFDAWVAERMAENRLLLEDWQQRGILKKVPGRENLPLDEQVIADAGLPVEALKAYMAPDFDVEPWYSDVSPYNRMGGQSIFFLRKK